MKVFNPDFDLRVGTYNCDQIYGYNEQEHGQNSIWRERGIFWNVILTTQNYRTTFQND